MYFSHLHAHLLVHFYTGALDDVPSSASRMMCLSLNTVAGSGVKVVASSVHHTKSSAIASEKFHVADGDALSWRVPMRGAGCQHENACLKDFESALSKARFKSVSWCSYLTSSDGPLTTVYTSASNVLMAAVKNKMELDKLQMKFAWYRGGTAEEWVVCPLKLAAHAYHWKCMEVLEDYKDHLSIEELEKAGTRLCL